MALALHEPELGYYAAGHRKFGAAGDFVTAPELSPLFGACLATQLERWLAATSPVIWEFGAGSGELAVQLLTELGARGVRPLEYRIVELSAELRARQRERIEARAPQLLERVQWVDLLPERIDGVVIANELLDALPVRLFAIEPEGIFERVVGLAARPAGGEGPTPSAHGLLELARRPADAAFARTVEARLARAAWPDGARPAGYCSEVGEQASAWVSSIAERLGDGAMLLIDYGFPAAELYHPARSAGTLNCHYRHRSHADALWWPGLCDITAHVDFSAVHDAAREAGLACVGYGSQASFLLGCGLAEHFASHQFADVADRARAAQALQMLVSEAEMGELFKVIAFARNPTLDALALVGRDRRAVLEG